MEFPLMQKGLPEQECTSNVMPTAMKLDFFAGNYEEDN
jgi:hypothetical protein